MRNLGYLFGGFALAWAATFFYVFVLARRAQSLQERIEALRRRDSDGD